MLRQFIMNNMLLRNMMLLSHNTDNYSRTPGTFTPYFRYETGPYQDNFILYFSKQPYARLYYNSIFLKLWAYNAHDAVKYLEAHYDWYPDKMDFLLFLKRELQYRLEILRKSKQTKWQSLSDICLEWVDNKIEELKDGRKIQVYNQYIKNELTVLVKNELQGNTASPVQDVPSVNRTADQIGNRLQQKIDGMLDETESKMARMAAQYDAGEIELANGLLKDKLITLFICLKNLTSKPKGKVKQGDPLFKNMSLGDIAKILRLHFIPFKRLKADSVERDVYKMNTFTNENSNSSSYPELNKMLQKFFFT